MALILTFLGKGGTGRTTIAIAAAKKLASLGKRVLLAAEDNIALGVLLKATLAPDPQELAPNLSVVQFKTSLLLERNWEEVKNLERNTFARPLLKMFMGKNW